ncbi:ATP-binding protein [Streptomyces sp. NPDC093589]|uniref:ATP-binding protein n=1 Tax=Streptomyces sp. NPDC093589 TaxID=3366043 RepID=UPI00382EA991
MTTYGTGTMVTQQPEPRPTNLDPYTRRGDGTLTTHLTAGAEALSALRRDVHQVLVLADVAEEAVHTVQLVLSELVSNAVRACGDGTPLIIEVVAGEEGIDLHVTDPEPTRKPRRNSSALDNSDAESGRGMAIIDLLCEAVDVNVTAIGKRIHCLIPTH